jgi:hypothetical protein
MSVRLIAAALALGLAACAGNQDQQTTASADTEALPRLPPAGVTRASGDIDDPIVCQESADSTSRVRRHVYCLRESEWEDRAEKDREALKAVRRELRKPR